MSLFTDLKDVLTPYAQRIKDLAAADEEIKADLGSADNLGSAHYTMIPSGTDLNDITGIGNYKVQNSATASSLLNSPVTNAGYKLTVLELAANRLMQIAYVNSISGMSSKIYTRNNNGTAWKDWTNLTTKEYVDEGLTDISDEIFVDVSFISPNPEAKITDSGVTIEYDSTQKKFKAYGTATANRRFCIFNNQNFLAYSNTDFEKTIDAGKYIASMDIEPSINSIITLTYTYTTFGNEFYTAVSTTSSGVKEIELTSPAMMAIAVGSGTDFGTESEPTYIGVSVVSSTAKAVNQYLKAVDDETTDENNATDMTNAITEMLRTYGYCRLGKGVYYVSGINMPEGSTLEGSGKDTVVRLFQSASNGYCIKISAFNAIRNVRLSGSATSISVTNQGTRIGVLFSANYDGQEEETAKETEFCQISNVYLESFSDSGIKCHNTSMNVRRGLYAVGVFVKNCYAGINIDYISEFNKFVNILTSMCKYGCINNGGNNTFTSCTFHASSIGFYIDGTKYNSGHGAINGCTFCHVGSNQGSAITIENNANGFTISDSQIWYCSIDVSDSSGIVFSGCEFGRGTTSKWATINVSGGNLVMFNGCVFMDDDTHSPSFTIQNNNKVRIVNCYGGVTGAQITA